MFGKWLGGFATRSDGVSALPRLLDTPCRVNAGLSYSKQRMATTITRHTKWGMVPRFFACFFLLSAVIAIAAATAYSQSPQKPVVATDLAARLDPNGERLVVGTGVSSEKPNVERISLTARAVLESTLIVVFISGGPKRQVVERILAERGYAPPIATLLRQTETPIRVLWTP